MDKSPQILAARVALVVSLLIFLVSLAAGIVSDSITLLLDAAAGFITLFMSIILHANIKKISQPPDSLFHFGYEKFEPMTVVIQGVLIMSSCVIASYFAVQDIIHAEDVARYDIPLYAAAVSLALALFTAIFMRRAYCLSRSHMLKASSLHWLVDSLFSVGMLLGFGLGMYLEQKGYKNITPYVDPVMSLILGAALIWTPVKLMRSGLGQLLDAAPGDEVRSEVERIIHRHKSRVFGVRSMRLRRAGEKLFLYVCFNIQHTSTMHQAQEFIRDFEADINKAFPKCDLIVYFYPEIRS